MSDDILAGVKSEGKPVEEFETVEDLLNDSAQETETSEESQPEENQNGEDPSQEGGEDETKEDSTESSEEQSNTQAEKPEPFHKHPRWKEMQESNQSMADELEQLRQKVAQTPAPVQESQDLPDWWIALAGDDEVSRRSYKGFSSQTMQTREEIRKELVSELQEAQQKAAQEEQYWNNWVDTELATLKEEGLKFDKNKLMKVAEQFQPVDNDGNISLRKSYEIMQAMDSQNKPTANKNKEVAAKTATTNNHGGEVKKKTPNPNDMRFTSFSSLVQD